MNEHDRIQIDNFFEAIARNMPGYAHAHFSYLALKSSDRFVIVQGRLQLQGVPPPFPSKPLQFQSPNIRAGIYSLSDLNLSPRLFADTILSGVLSTPGGELHFPAEKDCCHSIYYSSHHPDGISAQRRQHHLSITGESRPVIQTVGLDWEVKAAPTPFFNIQELCDLYFVGSYKGSNINIELIAYNVAAISVQSAIEGTKAKVVVDLAKELNPNDASVGFRIFDKNRVVERRMLPGSSLSWQIEDGVLRGKVEVEVPPGAVMDCVSNYCGVAQQHFWIADPKIAQNALRAVHNGFDPNLQVLRELITKAQSKGNNARDLEIAVAWLLWMLGFSVTHIGGTSKTSDAPDLIAVSPRGDFFVIDCTIGILKEDSKLPHLYQRAEKVRQSLAASGNQHVRVIPVIATTKTREEIASELDQAHKLGIAVATIETLPGMIDRSMLFPDANRLFTEVEETLRAAQTSEEEKAHDNSGSSTFSVDG